MFNFYGKLISARNAQEQKGAHVKSSIDDVMQKAYLLSDEIYGLLGDMMSKFKSNPALIAAHFPVFLLRYKKKAANGNGDLYKIKIAGGSIVEGGFSFSINEKINLYNTGKTDLIIYFVVDKAAAKPTAFITLAPEEIKTIVVKDYAYQNDRFMMIENQSATEEGEIEIILD